MSRGGRLKLVEKNSLTVEKHGGESVTLWGCFASSGTGNLLYVACHHRYLIKTLQKISGGIRKRQLCKSKNTGELKATANLKWADLQGSLPDAGCLATKAKV